MSTQDIEPLLKQVDDFAAAMKQRLIEKHEDGWTGWDDDMLRSHFLRQVTMRSVSGRADRVIGAANFLMMVWGIDQRSGQS